jgi:hypothetical protein
VVELPLPRKSVTTGGVLSAATVVVVVGAATVVVVTGIVVVDVVATIVVVVVLATETIVQTSLLPDLAHTYFVAATSLTFPALTQLAPGRASADAVNDCIPNTPSNKQVAIKRDMTFNLNLLTIKD